MTGSHSTQRKRARGMERLRDLEGYPCNGAYLFSESIPMPEGNIIESLGDASLAKSGLGFEAGTSLDDGLRQTIDAT